MLVMITQRLIVPSFNSKFIRFYPGDVVMFQDGVAYGKGIHFDLSKTEYSLIN